MSDINRLISLQSGNSLDRAGFENRLIDSGIDARNRRKISQKHNKQTDKMTMSNIYYNIKSSRVVVALLLLGTCEECNGCTLYGLEL